MGPKWTLVAGHVGDDLDFGPVERRAQNREQGIACRQAWFPNGEIPWLPNDLSADSVYVRMGAPKATEPGSNDFTC